MSSFAVGRSAVTIVGAFYDALVAGVTVTAEYEGANGARGGDLVLRRGQMFADAIGVEVGWRGGDKASARGTGTNACMALRIVITSSSLHLS